jgi:mycoredoxin-dependent peroxiredoxin
VESENPVSVGDFAPDFTLKDADRNDVTLSSFRGEKNVVLVFYVLAFTNGWRNELIAFRDRNAEFAKADTQVLGISVDTYPSNRAFAQSINLNFPLLSDFPKNEVTRAYGTYLPDRGTSRRITYVVDKEGAVRHVVISDNDMSRHAEESLAFVMEMEGLN